MLDKKILSDIIMEKNRRQLVITVAIQGVSPCRRWESQTLRPSGL